MVLSLGFILAFIGAAVALLIGILIFSEVSDSIICPAPAGGGGGGGSEIIGYTNGGTIGSSGDAQYFEGGSISNFSSVTGIINQGVTQNGTASGDTQGEVRLGVAGSTFNFLHTSGAGSNLTSINFWVNGDVDGAPEYPMLTSTNPNGGNENGILIYTFSTGTYLRIMEDDSTKIQTQVVADIPEDDAGWHMVTVMYDKGNTTGAAVKACIDGVCENTDAWAINFDGSVVNHEQALSLGAVHFSSSNTENTFDVDELTIWQGYILTDSDISELIGPTAGGTIASGFVVLYHSFDTTAQQTSGGGGGGGSSGQGNLECEGAKDTAWTVIGILPVALFFALFAIFGALGRTE